MGGGGYTRARRAPTKGLVQSPAVVRTIPRPFTKGINTDLASWALDPQEMPFGQDVIFPKGIASLRGPYISASASGALVSAASHWLTSAAAVDLPSYGGASGQPTTPVIVGVGDDGNVGMLTGALSGTIGAGAQIGGQQRMLIREVYKGEVLICPQDGKSPIYRYPGAPANSKTNNSAMAGSAWSPYQGTSVLFGVGTNFTSSARVGTYLIAAGFPGSSRLVVAVDDDTRLSVDGIIPITTGLGNLCTVPGSTNAWGTGSPSRLGVIGLCIPVQTLGNASISTGLGTSMTGLGTLWNTANTPPGQGRPVAGFDFVGMRAIATDGTGWDRLAAISSITNDTTIVMTAAPAHDYPNRPYSIYRNAMGRECRYHQGRLYITGVDWDPTGVYYMPVNSPLGAFFNPDQPTATVTSDYVNSQCLLKFDVPIQGAQGRNIALLSTPQGLLILRTDNAYLSMGDPPTQQVIEVAHGAGCIDILSACVGNRGEGAFWCGANGIYRYIGGRVIDLTEGRRNREWRQKMQTLVPDITALGLSTYVSCAVQDSHLFVAVNDVTTPSINSLWVYDLMNNAWCGDFSGATTISSMSMYRAGTLGTQAADDVYFTTGSTMGGVDRSQALRMGGIARDEGGAGTGALFGTFTADLPESVTGLPDDHSRVTEMKVTYELTGGDGTTKLAIQSGVDGSALGTDKTLSTNSSGPQTAPPIRPQVDVTLPAGGALGKLGRRHSTRFVQQGTKPSSLRVHHIDIVVRPRRHKA